MNLLERLPFLDDEELTNLWNNARRLSETGVQARRDAAVALLPAIETEMAGRRAQKKAETAKRTAERRAHAPRRSSPPEQPGASA